ncbi:MAG: type I methionyl aminopeptidase, partial [Propionibacteriaceae bacterium]|nr:type I methionyl aminopeptidase [Propionibacteriaceae bacterium]
MSRPKRRRIGIEILSEDELISMRQAGLVVARALEAMVAAAQPGVTTRALDQLAVELLAGAGAQSSFLGYEPGYGVPPYPAVSCLSVNDEVVHGIPSERVLTDGDLLSIDFGAILGGFHGDAARSVEIGKVAPAVAGLNQATEQALWVGIGAAHLDGRISDISAAIEGSLKVGGAKGEGYGIVRELTGHGIGHAMHQPPEIPNHGRPGRGPLIAPGMCLALEPMATLGSGA